MLQVVLLIGTGAQLSAAARRKVASGELSGYVQGTANGCECTSICGTSRFIDGHTCDTCGTMRCGKQSVTGRWDFCTFPVQDGFEAQSVSAKLQYYDTEIARDPNIRVEWAGSLDVLLRSFRSSVHTTFDNWLPQMPEGRTKHIHTIGSTCGVDFEVAGGSPYTGLLSSGTHQGYMRIGPASEPGGGLTPGVGFKFPRSGVPSGDFVAMHSTENGQSYNFFATNMSNHIAPAAGPLILLARKFEEATICSTQVGLSDFARYSSNGGESQPNFPFKLFFVPTAASQKGDQEKTVGDLTAEFASWSVGTNLLDVYGCGTATAHEMEAPVTLEKHCGGHVYLGKIKIRSRCSVSAYGDQKLHIRHQRIEEDWAVEPDFKKTGQEACGRADSDWRAGSPALCEGAPEMLSTES